jgi:hypothetical protein
VTTCDEVRPLLPEHALASLGDVDELTVRRHLRGCGGCRGELEALREGVAAFASTLERPAPLELRERVLGALEEEWGDTEVAAATGHPWRWERAAVAAALVLAVVAGGFGIVERERARSAGEDAGGYRTLLATLGGTGFRVGAVRPAGTTPAEGSVVAYESSHDQSFVLVFVRTPDVAGTGRVVVTRNDGTTSEPVPIRFDRLGDAATWWVTDRSVAPLAEVTVIAPDGSVLATASLREI